MTCVENILVEKLGEDTFEKLTNTIKKRLKQGYTKFMFESKPLSDEKIKSLLEQEVKMYIPHIKIDLYKIPTNGDFEALFVNEEKAIEYWKKNANEYKLESGAEK